MPVLSALDEYAYNALLINWLFPLVKVHCLS